MTYRISWIHKILFAATIVLAGCQTFTTPEVTIKKPIENKALLVLREDKEGPEKPLPKTEYRVGILVPLSGRDAHVGQSLYNAAKIALFNTPDHRMSLIPFDTKSSEEGTIKAFDRAIKRKIRVVVGPLRSNEAVKIKAKARRLRIPMIAFTNDIEIAENGIFVFGFDTSEQIRRLFQYTYNRSLRNVVAVIPDNPLGNRIAKDLNQISQDGLVRTLDIVRYNPNSQKHLEEVRAIKENSYEAIFIPEGGTHLKTILSSLLYEGVPLKNMKILGTGLWLDQDAQNIPALQGAWFVAPSVSGFDKFSALYFHSYKKYPLRICTLAFDAVQMLAALSKNTQIENPLSLEQLTKSQGFLGIDGLFRLNIHGDTERGLAVYTISANEFRMIDPAPKDFKE